MDLNNRRILIIKQSSLGDVVHTLPLAHALKRCFPSCTIGWIVERGSAPLIASDGAIDQVYPMHITSTSSPGAPWWTYGQAFMDTLRVLSSLHHAFVTAPYDLVLDLHASFRSGLLALTNPGGMRVGFAGARELNSLFQHRLVQVPPGVTHAVDKNLRFASFCSCSVRPEDFYICDSALDGDAAQRFLQDAGIGEHEPVVYVNATARWQSKFWLAERWGQLCDQLMQAGLHPVLGGGKGDLSYIAEITANMRSKPVIAAGQLSLGASVALIKRSTVYAGLDTGPMHIAAMAGTPVVALFGPTHPERVGPYGVRHVIVRAEDVACLCCRKRVCERMDCMRGISVQQVFAAVQQLLQTPDASS